MLMDRYFEGMKGVLETVEKTQKETLLAAAGEIAARLARGGAWHIMDTGHMLMFEGGGANRRHDGPEAHPHYL